LFYLYFKGELGNLLVLAAAKITEVCIVIFTSLEHIPIVPVVLVEAALCSIVQVCITAWKKWIRKTMLQYQRYQKVCNSQLALTNVKVVIVVMVLQRKMTKGNFANKLLGEFLQDAFATKV
jgi:hypothetical protein